MWLLERQKWRWLNWDSCRRAVSTASRATMRLMLPVLAYLFVATGGRLGQQVPVPVPDEIF